MSERVYNKIVLQLDTHRLQVKSEVSYSAEDKIKSDSLYEEGQKLEHDGKDDEAEIKYREAANLGNPLAIREIKAIMYRRKIDSQMDKMDFM